MASVVHPTLKQSETPIASYLDPKKRPPQLQSLLEEAFNHLAAKTSSEWFFNGAETYDICQINEQSLIKHIIQTASKTQKIFYLLDLGGGSFEWSLEMAAFLNAQQDLPKDITVHIVGTRGEKYLEHPLQATRICQIHRLGCFKIEELSHELERHGLPHQDAFDCIISNWCLTHLQDPVGTLVQAVDALKPTTGFLLFDEFPFLYKNQEGKQVPYKNIATMLDDANLLFLGKQSFIEKDRSQFIVQKKASSPALFPMEYAEVVTFKTAQGAQNMTLFNRTIDKPTPSIWYDISKDISHPQWLTGNHPAMKVLLKPHELKSDMI